MGVSNETGFQRTHICGNASNRPKPIPRRFAPVNGGMKLSEDLDYRYLLWCRWASGPIITWIMFNPSDADKGDNEDEIIPDPTINQIIHFSMHHEPVPFGGLQVVNLFAWRDSCKDCTLLQEHPIGDGDSVLKETIYSAETIAIAWGELKARQQLNALEIARERIVLDYLQDRPRLALCTVGNGRFPGHPMYKSRDIKLVDWEDALPYAAAKSKVKRRASGGKATPPGRRWHPSIQPGTSRIRRSYRLCENHRPEVPGA